MENKTHQVLGIENPKLSVIVIAHNMSRQAMNTIMSLSIRCQKNVRESDYEIIVIENESPNCIAESALKSLGGNIHYYRRNEPGVSPAAAINFALSVAKAPFVGLMVDGARMVTPRVIECALMASAIDINSLLSIPGYFVGPCEHQHAAQFQHTEESEKALLQSIQWPENPYRLFDICSLSAANPRGIFIPFLESNCFFTSKENFDRIGGADEDFQLPGGGALNLHTYRKIALLPECLYYFIAAGEGSFHQFHGGVTTSSAEDRHVLLQQFSQQLASFWEHENFGALAREPILIGPVTSYSQRILIFSARRCRKRIKILHDDGDIFWPDDKRFNRFTEQSL